MSKRTRRASWVSWRTSMISAALVCALAACSDDSGAASDSGVDAPAVVDLAPDTAAVDRGAADTGSSDGGAAEGGAAEGGVSDLGDDGSGTSDIGVDGSGTSDLGSAFGCASGQGTMVGTDVAACPVSTAVDQCGAAALCASGWALCTASQYQTRYGATTAPPAAVTDVLWLAGCVRDGAAPTAPVDGVCSSCGQAKGATVTVGWSCVNTVTTTTDSLYVGLRTSSACTSAGVDTTATRGFWFAWPAKSQLLGGLCCK